MAYRLPLLVALVLVLAVLNGAQYFAFPGWGLSDSRVADLFTQRFTEREVLFQNRWFGLSALQNPMDVWITQEIIWEVRPDVIVESGTWFGGSAALWATLLEHANPAGRVITIDVVDLAGEARKLPIVQRRVDFLHGSSTDPAVVAEVARRVAGKRVLVILDSLHTKEHVLAELEAYAPLVSPGSYLIVQDTAVNGHPIRPDFGPGPFEAVHAFLPTQDRLAIDGARERFMTTYNRNGFLKRVR